MKKILLAVIASAAVSVAFAAPIASSVTSQTAPQFDNTKMKCGEHTVKDGDNTDTLTGICKGFKFGKGKAGFLDENSGKKVMCQEKKGHIILSSCQAAPAK
ncbi:MAG: hypothetical protein E6Q32_04220 [Neisseriales bacterium]|jgi:Ni/Co efflux regulator RcnB|nr:hypothetical protein [uncultured Flavobacterium sp.]TXJ01576.1 MAG: hypothetical protein E6Q32_04220 [Neisseriales bacterium]HRG62806.1 hypothetical protein [Burkholderiales bacterium]